MTAVIQSNFRARKNFGQIEKIIDVPNLIAIQKASYEKFLQADTDPKDRKDYGLQGVFLSVFPIKSFDESAELVAPYPHRFAVAALGGSEATAPEGVEGEILEALAGGIQDHPRLRAAFAGELLARLLQMVGVKMQVAERVHKVTRAQSADLCHHHREEGIGRDIERNSEKQIGASWVELTAQL